MLINETSRLSQLTPAGLEKLAELMDTYNLFFYQIANEISETVSGMSSNSSQWYSDANAFASTLANHYDTTPEIVAGVISAVSPRMRWDRNKLVAKEIISSIADVAHIDSAISAAKVMGLGLGTNVAMAIKIARGANIADTLSGTKRRSFYNNIISPKSGDSVTVDTWMARSIMRTTGVNLKAATALLSANRAALGGTGVGYYVIAEACRNVAETMAIQPCEVQAMYWVAVQE